ncbi:MAG TPA: TonB-dependent receptor [Terriglobales bacterium]|nr:TonB-dependent receptor [Terriglobales bacterium]
MPQQLTCDSKLIKMTKASGQIYITLLIKIIAFTLFFSIHPPAIAHPNTTGSEEAQNPFKQMTLEQLGQIEVTTASRGPEPVLDTPAAVYVITQEDIQRSGATTIPDALRLAPGVEVAQADSHTWSVGIRGFGTNLTRNVLVLIDGRTVYTTLLAGTYWEVQNVMLEDVERIEVIRGPGATIWGPNAVNGVINIITKSTKETHGALVSSGGGNLEQGFLNARYGGGNNGGFDYRIYELGFNRGPQYHSDDHNFDRWRSIQAGFRADWAKNSRDTFTFQGDIYDEGSGTGVTAATYTAPYSQTLFGTERLSGGNLLARWQRVFREGQDFQLQVFYDRTNRHQPNFADLRDTFDIDFIDRFRLPGRHQISWGLGARFSRGDNPIVITGLSFLPSPRTDRLLTAFVQDEITVLEKRLTLSVGTKFLGTNYTGLQLQPTGRLLWTPTEKQSLWFAFTHAVRTPSDAERNFTLLGFTGQVVDGLPFFARFNPNPNFHSEQLNGYEAGYRLLLHENLYFDVAAFYNHYGDLFSQDITGPPFVETDPAPTHLLLPAQFGNGLLGTTKGVEIAPEWRPLKSWRLRAAYSYLQMNIDKARGSLDIGTAPFIEGSSPKHQFSLESGLDFAKMFSFDVTYRYVDALPALNLQIPSYSTADARFDWQVSKEIKLSAVGRNLLQPHHFESGGVDPGPLIGIKRNAYGQITWTR